VPTNKQRRDAARRHLERQLERRQEREVRRRKFTLVASIVGTLALIAVVVVAFTVLGSSDKKKTNAGGSGTSPTATPTPSASPTPSPLPSTSYPPATGAAVTFDGVTVKGATDLKGVPGVTSKSTTGPAKLEIKDLVVGKGAVATPTSTVNVQYYGVLYRNGTEFDSSWSRGAPTSFPLTGVVPGFTKGIGGTTGIPPMKVGGRRIIIMPASDGYGATANGSIPANSPLVFIVDLLSVTAAPSSS
jgi:peptidylprolyl isomerase